MRRLIYDGFLSKDTTDWILKDEYTFWIEVAENFPWVDFSRWVNDWPKEHLVHTEDCMGGTGTRMDNNGYTTDRRFLGLRTKQDLDMTLERWQPWIKNASPFKTEFS